MITLCMVSHGAMIHHQPTLSQIVQKIEFFSKGNPFQIPMLLVSTISRKGKGLLKRESGDQIKGNNFLLWFFWRIRFLKKKKKILKKKDAWLNKSHRTSWGSHWEHQNSKDPAPRSPREKHWPSQCPPTPLPKGKIVDPFGQSDWNLLLLWS